MNGDVWDELFPDRAWPGMRGACDAMADEIRALRLMTDTFVRAAIESEDHRRSMDEIQRAHDLVGQFCVQTNDPVTFEHVSALCWVLRHDHNTAFAQILDTVEGILKRQGISVVRLPKVVDPVKEGDDAR